MATILELKNWFDKHRSRIQEGYDQFLRFPSISADPAYREDCLNCANWLIDFIQKGKLKAERIEAQVAWDVVSLNREWRPFDLESWRLVIRE